ncbi:hypothetical protein [Micromonospora sp. NBC_01813]|uniref:hypothetical protein n=1 Tax=Micromonospora sp. NBC_01813 TaxID=2975988 RepID=UPI002DD8CD30|nr:hypothetical protein [Micromonospora sp. NBC_01813]WSA11100.1 hypothetical protein OG958_10200 [Micromonospora sp. NBC_01813]
MIRNDGIGGTPRLARYTSIGTPAVSRQVEPTPNRPPLARRIPGEAVVRRAREIVTTHLPDLTGECRVCGAVSMCESFTKSIAILDRWDPVRARRIRSVLEYAGLWPDGRLPEPDGTDPDSPLG